MPILQETENCNSKQNEVKTQDNNNSNDTVKQAPSKKCSNARLARAAPDENADASFVRSGLKTEIAKQVLRKKLAKLRHLVLQEAISPAYLDSLFPDLLKHFNPQQVTYNGGIANITEWKISCYLEVMEGGVPTANPNVDLLHLFHPLLEECNNLFLYWFRQKSACNTNKHSAAKNDIKCSRLMTFITRYTPAPGEQALLKVRNGLSLLFWDDLGTPISGPKMIPISIPHFVMDSTILP